MAEPNQKQSEEPKFSLFKPSEWPGFIRNWFVRLPILGRYRIGRIKVGERRHPIGHDLNKTWFPKNKTWFETKLETIEQGWASQGTHLGDGKDSQGSGTLRGNPDGIVKLYEELGAYSDIERLSIEIGFFEVGTGYFEENSFYGIPQDPNLWRELQWDVENEEVSKVMRDSSLLRNLPLLKQVKL